jgi:competence protein ComGC
MKYKRRPGLTFMEIMTVVLIMALLIGLLVPALTKVRKMAKEAAQKSQLATIEMAITAFRNDYGDYPPSDMSAANDYCGVQKLAEALVGKDLLGFHPKSVWDSIGAHYGTSDANLAERKGPYLELATANVFRLGNVSAGKPGLFDPLLLGTLAPDTFVICDMFGMRRLDIPTATGDNKVVMAGTPILYYQAHPAYKKLNAPSSQATYNQLDNLDFVKKLGVLKPNGDKDSSRSHALYNAVDFVNYITDPQASDKMATPALIRAYRSDSYILISAGADGLYGTPDDITNF